MKVYLGMHPPFVFSRYNEITGNIDILDEDGVLFSLTLLAAEKLGRDIKIDAKHGRRVALGADIRTWQKGGRA